MNDLETLLVSNGLADYIDKFRSQGFDSWASIIDITEDDLAAMDVKLGHRRKLQRQIANHRRSTSEQQNNASTQLRSQSDAERRLNSNSFSRPRKYRRHPKPDQHAPKRPLTAYVRFSNDKREQYRENGWSFPQLAKQIGHDWRCLPNEQRTEYLSDAEADKRQFLVAQERYRKTEQYRSYQEYLKNFNERHRPNKRKASMSSDVSIQEEDQRGSSPETDELDQLGWSPLEGGVVDFHQPLISNHPELTPDEDLAFMSTADDSPGMPHGNEVHLPTDHMFTGFEYKNEITFDAYPHEQPYVDTSQMHDNSFYSRYDGDPLGLLTTPSYT